MSKSISNTIPKILPEIIELRHELHQHPEIRFEERWTSDRIVRFLGEAGIPCMRGYAGGTGIVAEVKGAVPGKTIALRADMDALEIQEETGLPYASLTPGRMHACGHDGHVAVLCGTAKVLAQHASQFNGAVRFIFQPGEEVAAAGRLMVEEGVLDGADAVFALHGWPRLEVGTFGLKSGPMMAGADWFKITVHGRGCHGAHPEYGIDPVVAAAHIVVALQTITSRELNPQETTVVSVGHLTAGHAPSIIPDTALIDGTLRTCNEQTRQAARQAIERIAQHTAAAFRATATVEFGENHYAPLNNDPAMTALAREVLSDAFGPEAVVDMDEFSMASEDFAFYLQKVPGAYLRLGTSDPAHPPVSIHNAHFDFNDAALEFGIKAFVQIAERFLQ